MFEYILFDLDGTLTDPKLGITSSVQYALRALGIEEPSLDRLEPFIGPPLADSFREFYGLEGERLATAIDKYRERFATQGIFENEIYPGIPKMLADLKADCQSAHTTVSGRHSAQNKRTGKETPSAAPAHYAPNFVAPSGGRTTVPG